MLILRHRYNVCSRAGFACYRKRGVDLLGALFHSDQPETSAVDCIGKKSVTVIAKLQTNSAGIERESRSEFGRMRVLQRVGQGFLSNVEQVFLDTRCELAWLTV
jgi:hypothetical protein